MAQEDIRIPIKVLGARKARKQIEAIGTTSQKSAKGVNRLEDSFNKLQSGAKKLATAMVAVGAAGLKLGSDFQQIDRRLRSFSDGASELEQNMELLNQVSNDTRSRLQDNAAAFQRLALATKTVGGNSQQAAQILTTLNQAFAVGGASASEIAAATTQLGQALASGKLNGDELRSLTENASFLADALGNEIGGRGIASLRELSKEGKLTTDVLVDAFLKVGGDIEKQYQSLPKTIGEAFNELSNELTRFGEGLLPAVGVAIEGLELLIVGATRAKNFIERLARGQAIKEAQNNLDRVVRSIEKRRKETGVTPGAIAFLNRQVSSLERNRPGSSALIEFTEQRNEFLRQDEIFNLEFQAARERLLAVTSNDLEAMREAAEEFANLRARLQGRVGARQGNAGFDASQDPISQAIMAQEEARRESQTRTEEFTKEHLERMNTSAQKQFEKDLARYQAMEQALTSVFQVAGDALLEYTRTGEFNFQEFASSILETLQQILIQALITQAVSALLGGAPTQPQISGVGSSGIPLAPQFLPGFADGGTMLAGQLGVVGERGPELFAPGVTGTIIPNEVAFGGGGAAPVVNVYVGGRQIEPEIIEVMRGERGQRAQLENMNDKKTQTKRLLA